MVLENPPLCVIGVAPSGTTGSDETPLALPLAVGVPGVPRV